jgi:hypothetical protein
VLALRSGLASWPRLVLEGSRLSPVACASQLSYDEWCGPSIQPQLRVFAGERGTRSATIPMVDRPASRQADLLPPFPPVIAEALEGRPAMARRRQHSNPTTIQPHRKDTKKCERPLALPATVCMLSVGSGQQT